MDCAAQPVASAEYLAVDVETNGLGGDRCELTEVGAVLVGGGELHERWESLVRPVMPLSRGIERFTGITQAMVDAAPRPEEALPALAGLLAGRVLVAHNAAFDTRALRQAFARCGLDWPAPPVLCTVAMARRLAPLVRQRRLGLIAGALGVEVEGTHRALPDALTCARVFCALFPRLCANAASVGDAVALLGPRRPRRGSEDGRGAERGHTTVEGNRGAARARGPRLPAEQRPDLSKLPDDPGVYVSATSGDGRCTWASRCPCAPGRGLTSARRLSGRSAPRSSTTARRTPSWGHWCSRTA